MLRAQDMPWPAPRAAAAEGPFAAPGWRGAGGAEASLRRLAHRPAATPSRRCDADGDGSISRQELLPVIATWREIIDEKREHEREEAEAEAARVAADKQAAAAANKSSACTLL